MSAGGTESDRDILGKDDKRLAQWMGFSDVLCAAMAELAEQLDRVAEITERQAGESFDHLDAVAKLTGCGRLFAGAPPQDEREHLIEQNLQALLAGYVRADYLRQALSTMAELLRAYAGEANAMAAESFVDRPDMRSAALEVAERFRALHDTVGLSDLRRRMLGRLGGLEVAEECDDPHCAPAKPAAAAPAASPKTVPAAVATSAPVPPPPSDDGASFGMAAVGMAMEAMFGVFSGMFGGRGGAGGENADDAAAENAMAAAEAADGGEIDVGDADQGGGSDDSGDSGGDSGGDGGGDGGGE